MDNSRFRIINPRPEHFGQIQDLCRRVYPFSKPWSLEQLESHRSYFPDGQLIILDNQTGQVVGLAFSLIVQWDDYSPQDNWGDFTSGGFFHNHNPNKGKTLYGAEVMVDPELRGQGLGKMLYQARKEIAEKYNLKRIRAGARLRGYSKYQDKLSVDDYAKQVVEKKIYDPTLSFQLGQGFMVIDVAKNYLFNDPESLGHAAVIEWLNPKICTEKDYERQKAGIEAFLSGERFVPEFLPKELRRVVRKSTLLLGLILKEYEGERFFKRVEFYRENLKKARYQKDKGHLSRLFRETKKESPDDRKKLAHAFALHLEIINVCETAYRTWRLRQRPSPQGLKQKIRLTYVLTAHPTEARSTRTVQILSHIEHLLLEGMDSNFEFNEPEILSRIRMLWLLPLAKQTAPAVLDEAEYIRSLVFSDEISDFLLQERPNYDLRLRTWVGGDKDGHPGVDKDTMRNSLNGSREAIIQIIDRKLGMVLSDLNDLTTVDKSRKSEADGLKALQTSIRKLNKISTGDGSRVKAWKMNYHSLLKSARPFVKRHSQIQMVNRALEIFPALVLPLELRESSALIAQALLDRDLAIRQMLRALRKIAGALDMTFYARGLVISNCESAEDIKIACDLVYLATRSRALPIIPLFESREALSGAKSILKEWFKPKKSLEIVQRHWLGKFEVMLGYSDSSKQSGVLPSRLLIAQAMNDIESVLKKHRVRPVFFHGSGGSVARGGGSLKEQVQWWPKYAIENPKQTIQGEMIQRLFATKEILASQCSHLANEAIKRKRGKAVRQITCPELDTFAQKVAAQYTHLIENKDQLNSLINSTPYRYLDLMRIGSRPNKRPSKDFSVQSLRAIPWILCWTQVRLLLPTWWGIGTAWSQTPTSDQEALRRFFNESPFFSSFVKALGFTLAKVELDIWELYVNDEADKTLINRVRDEYQKAVRCVSELSGQKQLIWYRPWLEESIRLRAPQIHVLNFLQILAMEDSQEALLRETLVGIACGMLTTG